MAASVSHWDATFEQPPTERMDDSDFPNLEGSGYEKVLPDADLL
jgi:hypothetical protein